jgi:hypothetical protein
MVKSGFYLKFFSFSLAMAGDFFLGSVVGCRLSVFGCLLLVVCCWLSVFGWRLSFVCSLVWVGGWRLAEVWMAVGDNGDNGNDEDLGLIFGVLF